MHPHPWMTYAMQVHAITGLDETTIMERFPYVCGRHAVALWWQSKQFHTLQPGGGKPGKIDLVI